MPRYLYIFSYQTPEQQQSTTAAQGFTDESCEALFIEAESQEQALEWGRKVSEQFVQKLFGGQPFSWAEKNFAHWIETEPHKEYPLDVLERVRAVPYGEYPQF